MKKIILKLHNCVVIGYEEILNDEHYKLLSEAYNPEDLIVKEVSDDMLKCIIGMIYNNGELIPNDNQIDISNTVKSNEELTVENEYLTKCIAELTELLLV